jgi:glycosyltransferase involved in cell wall biosynthesis
MPQEPVISVVMPVRNEGRRLANGILSFITGRSFRFPIEFVIVDDASTDGCCDGLMDWGRSLGNEVSIRLIRLPRWSGIPYARNAGAAIASAPLLFITDANVEADTRWDVPVFSEMGPDRALCATIADQGSSWMGYGCTLDLPSMGVNWLRDPAAFGGYVPVSPCTGTVLYKALFRRLGGYDTAMPVYGAAEPEFSVRLWLYGAHIVSCPRLVLRHRFRPAAERKPFLDLIGASQVKNYLRFGLLYLEGKDRQRMLDHWQRSAPDHYQACLRQAQAEGLWERRRHLRERLPWNFGWYADRFGLRIYSNAQA